MARYGRRDWGDFYPRTSPRRVEGGVKARTKKGSFAKTWWGERFLKALEAMDPDMGGRLARGRNYARRGQVLGIRIEAGSVSAEVQGSRPRPYRVRIALRTIPGDRTAHVAERAGAQAYVASSLLGSIMPPELEDAFVAEGVPLFPESDRELTTDCSCPDWSNPCKHIAAVYYLLAEELDRDPFLLLRLRGIDPQAFLAEVASGMLPAENVPNDPTDSEARPTGTQARSHTDRDEKRRSGREERAHEEGRLSAEAEGVEPAPKASSRPEGDRTPLSADPVWFWQGKPLHPVGEVSQTGPEPIPFRPPALAAPLVRSLGPLAFWRGSRPLEEVAGAVLSRASGFVVAWLADAVDVQSRSDGPEPGEPEDEGENEALDVFGDATGGARSLSERWADKIARSGTERLQGVPEVPEVPDGTEEVRPGKALR